MPDPARAGDRSTRSTRFLWLIWAIWLAYLAYPISALLAAHPTPVRLIITLAATAIFVTVYLWTAWRFVASRALATPQAVVGSAPTWLPLVILTALGLALCLYDGKAWLEMFIYTSAMVGICLPLRWAALAVVVLALITAAVGLIEHDDWSGILQTLFVIGVTGFSVISLVWLIATNRALRIAREEIARLAVSEERLRFARDLHDLLGHSLSLIALKSELAGRLAPIAPDRAVEEIHDVEAVARKALHEVRAAVAGYRQPTLASELRGAEEILTAAGIAFRFEGASGDLPPALEAVLSWTVREGVTNVIRHSRAHHCTIHLKGEMGWAGVEVIDDGRGVLPGSATLAPLLDGAGSGLAGLAERVAVLGGRCEAGPRPEGGFRLCVVLPMASAEDTGGRRAELPAAPIDAVGIA